MPILEITTPHEITLPTPISVNVAGLLLSKGNYLLKPIDGGQSIPAQVNGDVLVALLSGLKASQRVRYDISDETAFLSGVTLNSGEGRLDIYLPEGPLGIYRFGPEIVRPYIAPLYGPGGKHVTRGVPPLAAEKQDHLHHTSLWTAYDEVNDVNNWHNGEGHGFTRHQKFTEQAQGPVFGGFSAHSLWTDREGSPILSEKRRVCVYNAGSSLRLMDYEVFLSATHGDVEIRDTKEAGVLAIRVATTMDGERGGVIENSAGGRGESQCWGKRASWCDYSGEVSGDILGIAMLSHPDNSQGDPRWHVRDYGLCGTNPFATEAFGAGKATPYLLKSGESLTFRYRLLLHKGRAIDGGVEEVYTSYSKPPMAKLI